MTNFGLGLDLPSNFDRQLKKGIKQEGSKKFASRVFAKASIISKDIGNLLVYKFESSIVAKALRGHSATDLPAHLGLSDALANAFVDGMAELIRSSVKLSAHSINGQVVINIKAVEDNWAQYLSLPGAEYISQKSGIVIPVAKWLLIDPNIDIGQASYDIVFLGESTKFDARIRKVSRSGRAIMVDLETLGGSGGYVLPNIISGQTGENFIEYTLRQPRVSSEAVQFLLKRVK